MSDITELMGLRLRMVCYSIKSVVRRLKNIFTITSAFQTPESSGNLFDKSSKDVSNNGEKSSHSPAVFIHSGVMVKDSSQNIPPWGESLLSAVYVDLTQLRAVKNIS